MVELIPKKQKIQLPRWMDILFYLSIVFFIASLIIFAIINWLGATANSELQDIRNQITQARSPERLALEADLKAKKRKIEDFAVIFASHYDLNKFFTQLEQSTHPLVWFSEISLDAPKLTVKLAGQAKDFIIVGQQLMILEKTPYFKDLRLSELAFGQDGVKFALDFSLDPKIFK